MENESSHWTDSLEKADLTGRWTGIAWMLWLSIVLWVLGLHVIAGVVVGLLGLYYLSRGLEYLN